jgi:hypothetical protein
MKKTKSKIPNIIISILIIVLAVVAFWFYFYPEIEKEKIEIDEKDFNLTQTEIENIDKIIMSDKFGNIIKLEKEEEEWTINNKYPVWKWRIEYLLDIMKTIRIKESVSEARTEYAEQNIATKGVKVEIFEGEQRLKSYYVGGSNKNTNATYMMIENAKNIYVVDIPTKSGVHILAEKYFIQSGQVLEENQWREPITINISPDEITEVKVIDFINKDQSYTINIKNKKLTDYKNNDILLDSIIYNEFASSFRNLPCGDYKPNLKPESFILSKKIYITNNNQTDSLIVYDKTKIQKTKGIPVKDFYAEWNNSDMVKIQNYNFNKVLITLDEIKKKYEKKISSM